MTDQEKDKLIKELITYLRHGYLIWSIPEVYCGKTQAEYWQRVKTEFLDQEPTI